jgi:MEDS: MEthanogen/methylotroph, DcmR Sensory domain
MSMNLDSYPRQGLRRRLAELGIAPERHRLAELMEMLPVKLDGRPYDEFDADAVAEVLVYLVGRGLMEVPSALAAALELPWGAHVCQFYRTEEELLELLVPYFKQGLDNRERCIWVLAPPLTPQAARRALGDPPDEDLTLVAAAQWNPPADGLLTEEKRALWNGYLGLRVATSPLACAAPANDALEGRRIKTICTYPALGRDQAPQVLEVLKAHRSAFVRHEKCWQKVQTTDARAAECILAALTG